MLHSLLVPADRLAQNGAGLGALVLHADLQALLWRVEVLHEIGFDLTHDCIWLQLAGQLEVHVEDLEPGVSLLRKLLLEAILSHSGLGLVDIDLQQLLGVLVLLFRVILHLHGECIVLGNHILAAE